MEIDAGGVDDGKVNRDKLTLREVGAIFFSMLTFFPYRVGEKPLAILTSQSRGSRHPFSFLARAKALLLTTCSGVWG